MNKPKRACQVPQKRTGLKIEPFGTVRLSSSDGFVTGHARAGADEIWSQYVPDADRRPAVSQSAVSQSATMASAASLSVGASPEIGAIAAQPELLERNIALENINKEKTRWLLTATHDLRNQLYAVRSYAELLSEEPADHMGLEQKKILEYLYGSVESMMHLLSDLTEIASTEDGNTRLQISSTALLPLLDECISICRPSARRKDIQLRRVCREPLPILDIDPEKIQQVCVELIENAIKYSSSGAKVELDAVPNDEEVLVSVRDNGPGIPPDELQSIFTPFQKTRARAACSEPGTGLGLAICKRTVELHKGRIWAESTVGEGTTVHMVLRYGPVPAIARSDQAQ
jgi:signal transduction histidine kinase